MGCLRSNNPMDCHFWAGRCPALLRVAVTSRSSGVPPPENRLYRLLPPSASRMPSASGPPTRPISNSFILDYYFRDTALAC